MNKNTRALLTYLFLVPLVYFIPPEIDKVMKLPRILNVCLSVGIIVVIMSYLVMPTLTKLFFKFNR